MREVACVGSARTILAAEIGDVALRCVTLVAGTHGDEPAAPWALLNIVESGLLHPAFSYRIWPCINPSGYERGTRLSIDGSDVNRSFSGGGTTPEAKAIITANRDRRFVASIDLHEDPEATQFYCFEPRRIDQPLLSTAVLDAVEAAGFQLQNFTPQFDLGYESGGFPDAPLEDGRVIVDLSAELTYFKQRGLPFTAYMLKRAAAFGLTLESPRTRVWSDRISIHRIAVHAALSVLAKVSSARAPN